jgi:YidC/Oxa1 family membrane protein insertase
MSLNYLYDAVSWVLLRWHALFTVIGLPASGGLNWALSIVALVLTARVLLFRFFIKQVHYQRRMQVMQPKIKKLQEKHKGDKATLQREMMALQQAEGFNPISGCLPIFLQLPIFISLFHVLKHMSAAVSPTYPEAKKTLYGFTATQTSQAAHAKLFGAPLAASLREGSYKVTHLLGGDISSTRIVIVILVIVSAGATLITQRAVIANAPTPAEGQAAMIQRLMMFGIPASVVFSGLIFPLGVLLYWFTSNLWTMGQQFYVIRFHPHTSESGTTDNSKDDAPKVAPPRVGARPTQKRGSRATVANASSDDANSEKVILDKTAANKVPPVPKPASAKNGNNAAGSGSRSNGTKAAPAKAAPSKAGQRVATTASPPSRSPNKTRR